MSRSDGGTGMNKGGAEVSRGRGGAGWNAASQWRRATRRQRAAALTCIAIITIAVTVAIIALGIGARSRRDDSGDRQRVEQAAAAAVTTLMTFAPQDDSAARERVAAHLTGTLAADYRLRGADIVFPDATGAKVSMSAAVTGAAVQRLSDDRALVLVTAVQEVRVGSSSAERIGVARWAGLHKVAGTWLLARLETVSPQ